MIAERTLLIAVVVLRRGEEKAVISAAIVSAGMPIRVSQVQAVSA